MRNIVQENEMSREDSGGHNEPAEEPAMGAGLPPISGPALKLEFGAGEL